MCVYFPASFLLGPKVFAIKMLFLKSGHVNYNIEEEDSI